MAKYTVYLTTTASMTVEVEVDDEGKDLDDVTDEAIDKAFAIAPRDVCGQCSGWRQKWSLDLGEFEAVDENPVEKKLVAS